MTYDPAHRDATWQLIVPGCYVDPAGYSHIFPDEILATLGLEYTEENYHLVVEVFKEQVLRCGPTRSSRP